MNLYLMLAGIFLGALVFAATLNAGWRAWTAPTKGLKWTQGIACGATILAMGALSLDLFGAARAMGLVLTLVSMANVIKENGWNRALPIVHFALGMSLADGGFFAAE